MENVLLFKVSLLVEFCTGCCGNTGYNGEFEPLWLLYSIDAVIAGWLC